jgi:hypothetical protein
MSRNTKILVNSVLVIIIIGSFAWGTVARGLGSWGTKAYSNWWNDDIFWANICQVVIPLVIIILLVVINRKK